MAIRPISLGDQISARAELKKRLGEEIFGFAVVDLDLVIVAANLTLSDLVARDPAVLIGANFIDLLEPADQTATVAYFSDLKPGKVRKRTFETSLASRSGDRIPVQISALSQDEFIFIALQPKKSRIVSSATSPPPTERLLRLATHLVGVATLDELGLVVNSAGQAIFGDQPGAIWIPNGDTGIVRQLATWPSGAEALAPVEFHQSQNPAIRFGRLFIHGLDESGLRCPGVSDLVGAVAFLPTFRNGRLAALVGQSIQSGDDARLQTLQVFADLVTEATVRVRGA